MNLLNKIETVTQLVAECYSAKVAATACVALVRSNMGDTEGYVLEAELYQTFMDMRNGYNPDYAAYADRVLKAFNKSK